MIKSVSDTRQLGGACGTCPIDSPVQRPTRRGPSSGREHL